MHIGIAADHGGFELKAQLAADLKAADYEVTDFGAHELAMGDDYPDFVVPLARAVARGDVARGIAICGSGVGACVAANKVAGVRAALITDSFSAHQGVEDDDMNIICLGGQVTGPAPSWDLVKTFLNARFEQDERFIRRLAKVADLERAQTTSRPYLYFRFRPDVGSGIQQVEYDLLQTYLNRHRGYDDRADAMHRNDFWAVMATSETGLGADAVEYTTNYLRSIPVIDELSISTMPLLPNEIVLG